MDYKEENQKEREIHTSPALDNLDEMLKQLQEGSIGINQTEQDGENGENPDGSRSPDSGEGKADTPENDGGSQTGSDGSSVSGQSRKKEPLNWKKELLSWIQVLVTAAVIAFLINRFIIANSRVPTPSMVPTIMAGDRIIGSRLSYQFGEPQRGDIAIFVYPDDEARGITTYYVKRIIGLPGDTVDIVDGRVYLNGSETPLEEPYLNEAMEPEPPQHYEVPEDSYFMMGDNRNNSNDSRRWNQKYVKRDKIIAKVLFQYFPKIQKLN